MPSSPRGGSVFLRDERFFWPSRIFSAQFLSTLDWTVAGGFHDGIERQRRRGQKFRFAASVVDQLAGIVGNANEFGAPDKTAGEP